MQILNLDADLNISRLDADIRTLRLGEGGTTNYNELTNKPSINSVTLTGNKTTTDLNIKTSDLINDAGFITNADIPTKTSDLVNDDGFQTAAQVSSAVAAAIPTDVSAFTNDAGYITAAQVGTIPTKTSDLDNDSGFITSAQAPVQSVNGYTGTVNLVASDIEVSAGVTVADNLDSLASSIPTKTSELTNDSGFITSLNVPSKTSDLVNDSGFVTNQIDDSTTADSTTWSSDKIVSYIASIPQTETITDTPIASFSDGADNVPVSSLIVDIDAVPGGVTEANIAVFDVNLWDEEWEVGSINDNGVDAIDANKIRSKNYIPIIPNTDYFIACPSTSKNGKAFFYDKNQTFISSAWFYGNAPTSSPANAYYMRFRMVDAYGTTYNNDISVNYPATVTDYHAFNGTTYNIPFGQSVTTGGTLNVTTGVLEITGGSSVQLTPTAVKTLLNDNNIFADTGNINELVYFKTGCEALARLIEAYT